MSPAGEMEVEVSDLTDLALSLMTTLAGVLDLYKMHTANHPDDDMRILTIGHCEAQIMKARRALYGTEESA